MRDFMLTAFRAVAGSCSARRFLGLLAMLVVQGLRGSTRHRNIPCIGKAGANQEQWRFLLRGLYVPSGDLVSKTPLANPHFQRQNLFAVNGPIPFYL